VISETLAQAVAVVDLIGEQYLTVPMALKSSIGSGPS
jgi:hypothetical protein